MLDDETIGFGAKKPVRLFNQRLGVDTPGIFKAALKATLAFFTSNAPGAFSAAIDASSALQLRPLPPAELAWLLIRRALAKAMATLAVEALRGREWQHEDKEQLVELLDGRLDGAEIWIDAEFFERPAELPIVEVIRPQFAEWLSSLGLNTAEATSVQHRLGAYFTFALRREWGDHAETYAPIEAEIANYENRFARADAKERAWLRNAAYLERLIQKPVFEETFGLARVYVPLRAWYRETPEKGTRRERSVEPEPEIRERRIVVDLERCLDDWLVQGSAKDPVRVICGGPGSGKTSFAKIWAAKLAREGRRVLYVPLHRLELRSDAPDVQAALRDFLKGRDVLPHDLLDAKEGERRLLLLFDGLDELAMQGRAGQELARSFVDAVIRKVDTINEREDRLAQVVLGGRDIVVQSAGIADPKVFHVLPYHGTDPKQFEDAGGLLSNDDYACDRWWRQFGDATGEGYEHLPEPLREDELAEITAQPLLNYLLALSYRRGKLDFATAPNLNLIYQDLLDAVYERPWGPGTHPTKKLLTRDEFGRLLDELGLAAWHGAGRTVTETQVEKACEDAGLKQQLAVFREQARAGAISLLAAFYFRQASTLQGGERTFEFTHKSFGEYLIARRLVRWMEDIHEDRALNRKSRQRGKTEEDALVKWIEVTGPTALDHDLLAFVQREVALLRKQTVAEWQKTFAELISDQLGHGPPMHKLGLSTYQEMTRQARNAEEALFAAHFSCATATEQSSTIAWPSTTALRDLINFLNRGYPDPWSLGRKCLGWLGAEQGGDPHELVWQNLVSVRLNNANLEGASLYRARLELSDLESANLSGAELSEASLDTQVNLVNAKLVGANLSRANLAWGTLTMANLTTANLSGAKLEHADLTRADLEGANCSGANLEGANLEGANLEGANLEGANLEAANLAGVKNFDHARNLDQIASWRGAILERKWVERLQLDADQLGLEVVDDLPEKLGIEVVDDLPDAPDLESDPDLPDEGAR